MTSRKRKKKKKCVVLRPTLSFLSSCRRMAKSLRAHSALQQGPRLLNKPALSTRLFRAAIFRAPKSCSNSLSASVADRVDSFRRMERGGEKKKQNQKHRREVHLWGRPARTCTPL